MGHRDWRLFQICSIENKAVKTDIISLVSTITTDKIFLDRLEILTVHQTCSAQTQKPELMSGFPSGCDSVRE